MGAGFAGIGIAIRLKQAGITDFVILERASDVGGTWRDNTYPGCQCDVPSHLYSFSFARNPEWTRTFSMQPEIAAYLRKTASDHGVMPHIRLDAELTEARWNATDSRWDIRTRSGELSADVLVMANGPLSEPRLPDSQGLARFKGKVFHSAAWDHEHDLSGERVAIVGTGASSVQFTPHVQKVAGEVLLFQRTPPWVLPHTDRPIGEWERRIYRGFPPAQMLMRKLIYLWREIYVFGFVKRPGVMKVTAKVSRRHMKKSIKDPELLAQVTPSYSPGCKRLILSNDWYPTLAKENLTLVPAALVEINDHSLLASDGCEYEVDTIIFGTGFQVIDNPMWTRVFGRSGASLSDRWRGEGMRAYKGTTVPDFPNMFMLAGPNTGTGHTSLVVMLEAQYEYLLSALQHMDRTLKSTLEVNDAPTQRFADEVREKLTTSVWSRGGCQSWYLDPFGRNPTLWPDFTWRFAAQTRRFDPEAYR